jgi:hypothetical protein
MKVYVNDIPLILFEGARVRDALNKYFIAVKGGKVQGDVLAYDIKGNLVMPYGALTEGMAIFIRTNPKS